jgi:hypothetical protein
MPRALWSGSIRFGLVNVPVRIYSAIAEHKLRFHYIHEKDESPIGYQKVCKKEGKPVPDKEITKAFEYRKGEYVYLSEEDFEAARVEGYKTIEITAFVPYSVAALRASIETAKGKRRPERALTRSRNGGRGHDDLAQLSKAELEERARKAKISGRSKMSKQQLVKALSNAE